MKASPADQARLLDVAALDVVIATADLARKNPSQTTRVRELLAQRQEQSAELNRLQGLRDDARTELSRVESDVALVETRAQRDAGLLSASSNAKEAQGLESEIASLERRKRALEDTELEIMERLEVLDAEVTAQEALIATTNEEGARLSAEAKAAVGEATAKFEAAARDRAAVTAELPADLVAFFDRVAQRSAGAALLRGRTCEGCRMVLAETDLREIRAHADDDIVPCPECGCILIRSDSTPA